MVKPSVKKSTKPSVTSKGSKKVSKVVVKSRSGTSKGVKMVKSKKSKPFARLSQKDPELFEFLKENDTELLDFDMDKLDKETMQDDSDQEETNEQIAKSSDQDKKKMKTNKKKKAQVKPLKRKKKAEEISETFDFSEEQDLKKKKKKFDDDQEEPEDQRLAKDELDLEQENIEDEDKSDDEDDDDEDDYDDDDDEDDAEEEVDGASDQEDDQDDDDEEDDDDDDEVDTEKLLKDVRISEETLAEWADKLQTNPDKDLLKKVVLKFKSAVKCISGKSPQVRAEAALHFNSIFKMVLLDLYPALIQVLKLDSSSQKDSTEDSGQQQQTNVAPIRPKKSLYWKKYAVLIKVYLNSLLEVLDTLANDEILATLLKHLLNMVPFFLCYLPLVKRLLRQVSTIWSEGTSEQTRVLSFLIILRMLRDQKSEMIGYILKKLYISYIKNCKFTDQHNLAMINFMRQSLVELYSLDQGVAYQHAFVFIRQCGITLRNSMMSNKKEGFKAVYNWQYIHSLLLWSRTISCLYPSDVMQPLIFPLVQVIFGTIKLIPSSRYIPLRVHLIKSLIKISSSTNTFVPILPHIIEILDIINRGQKYKVVKGGNRKKINVDCILKLPNDFIDTTDFVDLCIHQVYELILDYCTSQSHSIAFPELILLTVCRLKKFIKNWKNPAECKMLKQLSDKLNESSRFIEDRRRQITFNISEKEKVDAWEKDIQLTGSTPLYKFSLQWKKISGDQTH